VYACECARVCSGLSLASAKPSLCAPPCVALLPHSIQFYQELRARACVCAVRVRVLRALRCCYAPSLARVLSCAHVLCVTFCVQAGQRRRCRCLRACKAWRVAMRLRWARSPQPFWRMHTRSKRWGHISKGGCLGAACCLACVLWV